MNGVSINEALFCCLECHFLVEPLFVNAACFRAS